MWWIQSNNTIKKEKLLEANLEVLNDHVCNSDGQKAGDAETF